MYDDNMFPGVSANMPHDNHAIVMRAVILVLIVLSWPAVLLRCYVRIFMVKKFGVDDWLMIPALVSLIPAFLYPENAPSAS